MMVTGYDRRCRTDRCLLFILDGHDDTSLGHSRNTHTRAWGTSTNCCLRRSSARVNYDTKLAVDSNQSDDEGDDENSRVTRHTHTRAHVQVAPVGLQRRSSVWMVGILHFQLRWTLSREDMMANLRTFLGLGNFHTDLAAFEHFLGCLHYRKGCFPALNSCLTPCNTSRWRFSL